MEINSIILSLSRNQGKYAAEDLLFCISGNGIKQVRAVVIIAAAPDFLFSSIFPGNLLWAENALKMGLLTRPKLIKTPTKPLFGADVRFAPPSAY